MAKIELRNGKPKYVKRGYVERTREGYWRVNFYDGEKRKGRRGTKTYIATLKTKEEALIYAHSLDEQTDRRGCNIFGYAEVDDEMFNEINQHTWDCWKYVRSRIDGKDTLLHRYVMSKNFGRPLRRDESVHHINGNSLDNRLSNLQLRIGNHGQGKVCRCKDCGSYNIETLEIKEVE